MASFRAIFFWRCFLVAVSFCIFVGFWLQHFLPPAIILRHKIPSPHDAKETVKILKKLAKIIQTNLNDIIGGSEFKFDDDDNFGQLDKIHRIFLRLLTATDDRDKRLKIALASGSTSVPRGVQSKRGYFQRFCSWWSTLGITDVQCDNLALGGTSSDYFAACIHEHINLAEYDILIVEFAANDWDVLQRGYAPFRPYAGRPMEELIRSVLRRNPVISIILVNLRVTAKTPPLCQQTPIEMAFLELGSHYAVPVLEPRHLICKYATSLKENFSSDHLYRKSPEAFHYYAAGLLVNLFQSAVRQLEHGIFRSGSVADFKANLDSQLQTVINEQTNGLTSPLYPTTRKLHDASCFLNWNNKTRSLSSAFLEKSADVFVKRYDHRDMLVLPRNGSFVSFRLANLTNSQATCELHRYGGYLPKLGLVYHFCYGTTNIIDLTLRVIYSDNSTVELRAKLRQNGKISHSLHLVDVALQSSASALCIPSWKKLIRVDLHLQMRRVDDEKCGFQLLTVLMEWNCCKIDSYWLFPLENIMKEI